MIEIVDLLELFARGGGGGGGSSSGGGGSGILLIGYVVPYYATSIPMKRLGRGGALAIGIPVTIIWIALLWLVFGSGLGTLEAIAAVMGFSAGYKGLHAMLRKKIRFKTS